MSRGWEEPVKNHLKQFIVCALITLGAPGAAQARDSDEDRKPCSDATLHGLYVFTASGFNIVGGGAQPKAIVELIRFNGDGSLTVPASTVSINGVITRSPPDGPGSYEVRADCTGSLVFGPPGPTPQGPTYDLFVGPKGSEINMIQTGPGAPVFQGTAERQSR
jgi:hypothetical protein